MELHIPSHSDAATECVGLWLCSTTKSATHRSPLTRPCGTRQRDECLRVLDQTLTLSGFLIHATQYTPYPETILMAVSEIHSGVLGQLQSLPPQFRLLKFAVSWRLPATSGFFTSTSNTTGQFPTQTQAFSQFSIYNTPSRFLIVCRIQKSGAACILKPA
jgi:hypothetical protein